MNERFGLLPEQLAAASERGIVYMSANAYGHSGPWKNRPGFDQNGQVASGFAMAEGQGGPPKFSPVFYLADLITGYFAAAGMMAALHRRAIEGGSYQVKLSLARSAMWVQELGLLDVAAQRGARDRLIPSEDSLDRHRVRRRDLAGTAAHVHQPDPYRSPTASYPTARTPHHGRRRLHDGHRRAGS